MEFEPYNGGQRLPACDTFFVEPMDQDDDGYYAARRSRQEIARMNAETQMEIAEELSRITAEEYEDDILEHMEFMEGETLADVASIDIQTEIQWFMRPYLLEFLIEAHTAFSLLPETLFLTINLLDRYCSRRVVYKRHYQLVGCAAMLIAAKYGDKKDRVPTVRELKSMCCNLHDEDMFIQMEWHVLQTLGWVIGHPTIEGFLQIILQDVYDPEVEAMSRYMCEIALFHKEFVGVKPSVMARTSLALARYVLNRSAPLQTEWASKIDTTILVLLSQRLHGPSQILVRKYASPEFACVSTMLEEFMQQQALMARQRQPPTPPSEGYGDRDTMMEGQQKYDPTYMTPQKNQHQVPPGYITPPVTPSGGYFIDGSAPQIHNHAQRYATPPPPPPQQPYYVS